MYFYIGTAAVLVGRLFWYYTLAAAFDHSFRYPGWRVSDMPGRYQVQVAICRHFA